MEPEGLPSNCKGSLSQTHINPIHYFPPQFQLPVSFRGRVRMTDVPTTIPVNLDFVSLAIFGTNNFIVNI